MNNAENTKRVGITPPAAIVNNAAITTASVDTKGWDYARIVFFLGATDIALTVARVQESDDDGSVDPYATITGADLSVSPATLPSATDDNKLFAFDIDLRAGRKRYLDLNLTVGNGATGAFVCAWAELYRGRVAPSSAAARGFSQQLYV